MPTPIEKYQELAKKIGVKDLYFKREDLGMYGSHKGRSIPIMIDYYVSKGDTLFTISSSGNAALAAILHINSLNKEKSEDQKLKVNVYVGKNANKEKVDNLIANKNESVEIFTEDRPLQAMMECVKNGARSLRQSTDNISLLGYKSLAQELENEIFKKKNGAIFIATSSGTTAEALAEYFNKSNPNIQIHIVQTSSCHPMTDGFNFNSPLEEQSIADAIVDQIAYRKNIVIPLVKNSNGYGWQMSNEEILSAINQTKKYSSLDLTPNGVLSVAGVIKAIKHNHKMTGPIICIIGGK